MVLDKYIKYVVGKTSKMEKETIYKKKNMKMLVEFMKEKIVQ